MLTLWCRSRKGSSISMPPSCTIHQTSMLPSEKRSGFPGNMETFLVTNKARWPAVVSRTSSGGGQGEGQMGNSDPGPILHQQQPQGLPAPSTRPTRSTLALG